MPGRKILKLVAVTQICIFETNAMLAILLFNIFWIANSQRAKIVRSVFELVSYLVESLEGLFLH